MLIRHGLYYYICKGQELRAPTPGSNNLPAPVGAIQGANRRALFGPRKVRVRDNGAALRAKRRFAPASRKGSDWANGRLIAAIVRLASDTIDNPQAQRAGLILAHHHIPLYPL